MRSTAGTTRWSPDHPSGDAVDLDQGVTHQVGDADAGARRPRGRREEAGIDLVHRLVVALEVRQEHAHAEDIRQRQIERRQDPDKVLHRLVGLCSNAVRQRLVRIVEIATELACQKNETIRLRGVATGRDRAGKSIEDVELVVGHRQRNAMFFAEVLGRD